MGLLWCLLSVTASFGNRLEELLNWGCDDVQIILNISAEPAGKGGNYKTRVNSPVRHVRMGNEMLRGQRWALPFTCIYTLQYRCPFIALRLRRSLGACCVELKNLYEFHCWRERYHVLEEIRLNHECNRSREKSGQNSHGFPHMQIFTAGCHCG